MLGNLPSPTTRRCRWLGLVLAGSSTLATAACSTLPGSTYPPFADHDVTLAFTVPSSGHLPLPTTSPTLCLHSLQAVPTPAREWYDGDGQRWFDYAPGTKVTVHTRCRVYATADGKIATPGELFAGAEPRPSAHPDDAPR